MFCSLHSNLFQSNVLVFSLYLGSVKKGNESAVFSRFCRKILLQIRDIHIYIKQVNIHMYCMLWFNFIPSLSFRFFSFKLIFVHYHTQKQKKIKFKPRIKLNHNMYITKKKQSGRRRNLTPESSQKILGST